MKWRCWGDAGVSEIIGLDSHRTQFGLAFCCVLLARVAEIWPPSAPGVRVHFVASWFAFSGLAAYASARSFARGLLPQAFLVRGSTALGAKLIVPSGPWRPWRSRFGKDALSAEL